MTTRTLGFGCDIHLYVRFVRILEMQHKTRSQGLREAVIAFCHADEEKHEKSRGPGRPPKVTAPVQKRPAIMPRPPARVFEGTNIRSIKRPFAGVNEAEVEARDLQVLDSLIEELRSEPVTEIDGYPYGFAVPGKPAISIEGEDLRDLVISRPAELPPTPKPWQPRKR